MSTKLTLEHTRVILHPIMTIHIPMNTQSIVTMANENVSRVSLQVSGVHPSVTLEPAQGMYEPDLSLPHVP